VCNIQPGQLAITINDDSPPFDPTDLPEVDTSSKPLQDRQPGGLGWFFIKKTMNVVFYTAKEGRNYLTMIKYSAQREANLGKTPDPLFPTHELRDGIWVVALSGRLDSSIGSQLESALTAQLDAAHLRLVIDMSNVSYISSSGLKALVSTWRSAQKRGGNVVLSAMNARVREVFEISGFDSLFTITETVDEAAAAA
jgi:anti-anti-sigma factor